MKNAFWHMYPEGMIHRTLHGTKWGVQMLGMIFQTCSNITFSLFFNFYLSFHYHPGAYLKNSFRGIDLHLNKPWLSGAPHRHRIAGTSLLLLNFFTSILSLCVILSIAMRKGHAPYGTCPLRICNRSAGNGRGFLLFSANILVNSFCRSLARTHGKNHRGCACYGVSAGEYARF